MIRRFVRAGRWLVIPLVLAFLWGPLIPWSPWKPGWERIALSRADVYHAPGARIAEVYRTVDSIIAEAEDYHALKTKRRYRVFVCPDWFTFRRHVPWIGGTAIGAVTLWTGTAVYVTPKLDERGYDHGEYLRHEILHAVAHQRQPLWKARAYSAIEWLSEGSAVSFGRQRSYEPFPRFVEFARTVELRLHLDPDIDTEPRDLRLLYPLWRYFNEYLRATSGVQQHQFYVRSCVRNPGQWRELFPKYFGASFESKVADFQAAVRSGAWRPAE